MIAALLAVVPRWALIAGGAALGGLLAFGPVLIYGKSLGKTEAAADAAREAVTRIQRMEKNDAKFKTLSARDRCLAIVRDSGLSDGECDER